MSDIWTDQLSAYLDGDLDPEDQSGLENHLEGCDECQKALKELRGVVGWARTYEGSEPERDVWPAVSEEIRKSDRAVVDLGATRNANLIRGRFRLPQAIAAVLSLLIVGSGGWWFARSLAPQDRIAAMIDPSPPAEGLSVATAIHAAQTYGPAIADLERVLMEGQGILDTSTVRVLRERLAVIDRAMQEAREALVQDPNSGYLVDHYTDMMRKKLNVLRTVARRAGA